ncbi:MAG: hypothetical protein KAW01_02565 [Deltaproteobacteria bacterium]|nr:hypothetical protein [Deltaproteobacteria bacterium]
MGTLAEFLAYVQIKEPFLGKALDYLLAASLEKQQVTIVLPEASIPLAMVMARRRLLQQLADDFWLESRLVNIHTREVSGELRLFALEASKYWNDLVFFLPVGESCDKRVGSQLLAAGIIAKPDYEKFKKSMQNDSGGNRLKESFAAAEGEIYSGILLEKLVATAGQRAQKKRGIAHFVTLSLAAEVFLSLDYHFLRLKEFGICGLSPLTTRNVLGHLHAVFPGQYCAGLSLVHQLSGHF